MNVISKIAIVPSSKGKPEKEGSRIIRWLEDHGLSVVIPESYGKNIGRVDLERSLDEIRGSSDLLLSLGGDGTLLHACSLVTGTDIPVLGVNLGHLGFLTETNLADWESILKRVLAGDFEIRNRMMAECHVYRAGESVFWGTALNDIVVNHANSLNLLKLSIKISGNYAGLYAADGVVIATPTGSTAYSLSAGGPIVHPQLECFIMTAISPHTLSARPLVIPPDETVEITEKSGNNCVVILDGANIFKAEQDDIIQIKKCFCYARFVHVGKKFYTTIREKLRWFE